MSIEQKTKKTNIKNVLYSTPANEHFMCLTISTCADLRTQKKFQNIRKAKKTKKFFMERNGTHQIETICIFSLSLLVAHIFPFSASLIYHRFFFRCFCMVKSCVFQRMKVIQKRKKEKTLCILFGNEEKNQNRQTIKTNIFFASA